MSKKLFLVLLSCLLLLTLGVFGCGTNEKPVTESPAIGDDSDPFANLPEVKMTVAHTNPADPTQHVHAGAVAFKEYVERESKGNITVEISPAGALGDSASLQEQVMMGEIEAISDNTEGTVAIVYPDIQVIAIPYLFDSVDQALEVFRGDFGKAMFEDMRVKTGLRNIAVWDNGGFRSYTNNLRPVNSPEDMKGLKIRTMEIPAHMEIVRSLGGTPTPIPWGELYSALETGVVDGQENALPTIIMGSIYEVQDYLVLDNHVYSQEHFFVNDEWFSNLPSLYQDIILRGGEKAGIAGERASRINRDMGVEFLSQYMEIYNPTTAEIAMFREATQANVLKFIREGINDPSWVDEVLKAAEDANKKLGFAK